MKTKFWFYEYNGDFGKMIETKIIKQFLLFSPSIFWQKYILLKPNYFWILLLLTQNPFKNIVFFPNVTNIVTNILKLRWYKLKGIKLNSY